MEVASMMVLVTGAFLGALVCGLSGFAYALVAHAIWAHAVDPQVAVPLAVAGAVLVQGLTLPRLWRKVDSVSLWPLVAGGFAGIPFGFMLLNSVEGGWFRPLIGCLLVLFALRGVLVKRLPRLLFATAATATAGTATAETEPASPVAPGPGTKLRGTGLRGTGLWGTGLWGTGLWGTGLWGTGLWGTGLWEAAQEAWRGTTRHDRRGAVQLFIVTLQGVALVVFLSTGTFDLAWGQFAMLCGPAVCLGAFAGFALYNRVDDRMFGVIVRGLLGLSGASLIVA